MVAHSYYEEDPRVRREAEALVAAGRPVDVFSLRRPGDEPAGTVDGVAVHRVDVQRHQGAGLGTYLREYLAFFAGAMIALVGAQRRRRYALVQVHTLPDFLAFAALPLRLVGVPVLLDLHEAMPEFFRGRFPRADHPVTYRLLRLQERLSIAVSTHALTVNDALRDRLTGFGVAPGKVSVVRNSPVLARFDPSRHPSRAFMEDGVLRLVYAGALTPTYELDVAIDAVARVAAARPALAIRFDVYGRGDSADGLARRADELGLGGRVVFHGRIPLESVAAAVAATDVGLAPTRRDPFTDVSLSTKIYEYAAMRKPVVASRLPLVAQVFPLGTVMTYTPGDAADLAARILDCVDDPAAREAAVEATARLVAGASWERESVGYIDLVERLIDRS